MTASTNTNTNNTMKINTSEKPSFNRPERIIMGHSVHFPYAGANTVSQSGRALSKWSQGLTVNVYQFKGSKPHSWEVYTDDEEQYAEGCLGFHENTLEDYDGCFSLPSQVMDVLDALGYDTQSMRESLS
jgi:hypothetical protein